MPGRVVVAEPGRESGADARSVAREPVYYVDVWRHSMKIRSNAIFWIAGAALATVIVKRLSDLSFVLSVVPSALLALINLLVAIWPVRAQERKVIVIGSSVFLLLLSGIVSYQQMLKAKTEVEQAASARRAAEEHTQTALSSLSRLAKDSQRTGEENIRLHELNLQMQKQLLSLAHDVNKISKDTLVAVVGGDSYPDVTIANVTGNKGERQFGFYVTVQAARSNPRKSHPVSNLAVMAGRIYRNGANGHSIVGEVSKKIDMLLPGISMPLGFVPVPEEDVVYYGAFCSARNGNWETIFEVRRIGQKHLHRQVVYSYGMPMTANGHKILDVVDTGFPQEFRNVELSPLTVLPKLPIMPAN